MDYSTLHSELVNDPEALGYQSPLSAGAHNQVADLLNEPRFGALGSVPITPLLEWIAKYGVMARLRAAAAGSDPEIASIAEVALMLVNNPNIPALELGRERVQQMLGALTQAEVIPQEANDELIGMATTQRSRAAMLGLGWVSASDVSKAMEA